MQQVTMSSLRDSVSLRAFRLQQQKRLLVELLGSFFLSAVVFMSQSATFKSNVAVAIAYGSLIYCISPQMSGMGASFNPGVAVACLISGAWDSFTFALAIIGQILGTVLGSLLGLYIHKHAYFALMPKKGMYRYDLDIILVDFLFCFLLSLVGSSGMTAGEGVRGSMSYPIAMTAVIISAGLVASTEMPFTALNPIIDIAFTPYLPSSVVFVRIIISLAGGLIAGLASEAMKNCDRRQDDMTLAALCGRGEVIARPSEKQSWITGFLLEGAGTFYMTITFCLAAHRSTSENITISAVDAQAIGVGSVVVALSYLSHGGCFNPAVAFAVYLQDRNCTFPTMSTWSLLLYSLLHIVAAFIGAMMCLWICSGVIPIPDVKPIFSAEQVAAYSETLLSGLIIMVQLFTSAYAARVWTTPTTTVVRLDQQGLAVGFAVATALLAINVAAISPVNPAISLMLCAATELWRGLKLPTAMSADSVRPTVYWIEQWIFIVCPFIAAVIISLCFSAVMQVTSTGSADQDTVTLLTQRSSQSSVSPIMSRYSPMGMVTAEMKSDYDQEALTGAPRRSGKAKSTSSTSLAALQDPQITRAVDDEMHGIPAVRPPEHMLSPSSWSP